MAEPEDVASGPTGVIAPGTEVDHFKVIRLVGRGGMGEVYLARDTQLGRRVALKVIHADALGNETEVKRFLREAQITARFSHPHIVTIYSVGEHKGSPYLALEYLSGQSLRERLDEDRPGLRESLRLGLAIAEALCEAHRHGVLHRDLKPGNVLVPRDGRVRVLDFGLSRAVPAGEKTMPERSLLESLSASDLANRSVLESAGGGLKGTPAYMAPEQWAEQPGTAATDVWALGLILYELAAGKHPFQGMAFFNLALHVGQPDPVASVATAADSLPEALVELIDHCLIKDPAGRPRTEDVVDTLTSLVAGEARRTSTRELRPFRGLLPFSERHADHFFGRDSEIASFLERLREEPLLPVVGPSGAGKSSFVHAGVIPRLREQGLWEVLSLRPGRRPFETLAARLMSGETVNRTSGLGSVARSVLSASRSQASLGADVTLPAGSVRPGDFPLPTPGPHGNPSSSVSGIPSPERTSGDHREQLADELMSSPARLSLLLSQLAETRRSRVLLFVDQLEEIFTLVPDESVRQAFMQALAWAADDPDSQVRVIFTLRDDFLGRLATGGWAQEALGRVQVLGTPGPLVLTEILTRPVEAVGYRYEDPELVQEMVQSVKGEPAALPLLQFAGQMLWERRDPKQRLLTREAYKATGGVAGALAQQANGVLDGMAPEQEQIARQIFVRLVTPEGTRRVLPRSQLLEGLGSGAEQVLDRLTSERVILGRKGLQEAELELVHESLIRSWDRLARWLDDSREERSFLTDVGQAAALWEKRGRPETEAWQGEALRDALRRAGRCASLPSLVDQFLKAGERRDRRRLWTRRAIIFGVIGLSALIAVASLVVSVALRRKEQKAQRSEREAQIQRRQAVSKRAEAQREGARAALLRHSLIEARAKLRGSLETRDSPLARALWWRLQKSELFWQKRLGGIVYALTFSPTGDTVAVACQDHSIYVFDVQTGAAKILRGHKDQVFSVAYSPNGRQLASGSWDGVVRIWDLKSKAIRVLHGHKAGVRSVVFSPDGTLLASASFDRTVRVWRVQSGETKATLTGHAGPIRSVTFSPDGSLLASASEDGTARLWRVATGTTQATLVGHQGQVISVDFHPTAKLLATASIDGTVRLWHTATGAPDRVLKGHTRGALVARFSPDGALLAGAGRDGKIRLWTWKNKHLARVLTGHGASIVTLGFSPDGKLLASGGYDQTAMLWRVSESRGTAVPIGGHSNGVVGASFSPDGRLLASGSLDNTVRLWEVSTGHPIRTLEGHLKRVYTVRFSPDGKRIASGSTDRTVRIWSVETGRALRVLRGHKAVVADAAYSPDGQRLATASYDQTVRIWDPATGQTLSMLRGHTAPVRSVSYSPDGRTIASGSFDKTIRLWDANTGQLHKTLSGHTDKVTGIAFAPKGDQLVSGGGDKTVRLWDLKTGNNRIIGRCTGRVYWVAYHPSGQQVAASCSDGTARIWELKTGNARLLSGHTGEVNFILWSPDGSLVATTSDDSTVRLWQTATGGPRWRAPILLHAPVTLFTHRGWSRLDDPATGQPTTAGWKKAVERKASVASSVGTKGLLCLGTHDGRLEIWDRQSDKMLVRVALEGLQQLLALPTGCATLAAGSVKLYDRTGAFRELMDRARAITLDGRELLIAAGPNIVFYSDQGAKLRSTVSGVGVSAMTRTDAWLVVGFRDGNLELIPTKKDQKKPTFTFEDVPSSPVTRLLPGPTGTIIAGFANGLVGLWTLDNGTRLEHARLHGSIQHLLLRKNKLYVASELGQHLTWDLGVFYMSYCELLRTVWRSVPVLWEGGLPRLRAPPVRHRCTAR